MQFNSLSHLKTTLFFTALSMLSVAQAESRPLTVYTYDSFTAEWGAGPQVKALFEQQYPDCTLNYVSFDSSGTLFNRLRLEGQKTQADVVLGLDNYVLQEAEKTALFSPNQIDLNRLALPIEWKNSTFLPYDFGRYAFIYNKNTLSNPPKSLRELVERQDLRVIYQDPRTSSVGRGLVIWVNQVYAEQAENAWRQLAGHTVTVGKGWSESYGAFLKGEADLVLSYQTSPLYHLIYEQKDHYVAADFQEGGILQIELAAKVAQRDHVCAEPFLDFLISPAAQKVIAQHNVMLPVIADKIEPHFDALRKKQWQLPVLDTSNVNAETLKTWIRIWQLGLSQ